jgi:hypothetical protein
MPILGAQSSTETLLGAVNVHRTTFTCNGATPVSVVDPGFTIGDAVIVSLNTVGGTVGALPTVATVTAGTGFTIKGTASDTSIYNLVIIRATP